MLVFNSEGAFVLELDTLLFFFEVVLAVTVGPLQSKMSTHTHTHREKKTNLKLLDLDLEFTFAMSVVTMVLVMTVRPLVNETNILAKDTTVKRNKRTSSEISISISSP